MVKQGVITPVELEAEVLAAVYGAGLFLLDAGHDAHFEIGVEHMVGPVVLLDLYAAFSELDRRRRALADTYPDSCVDDHAVVPVRRLPGHNVALSALQWEIVAHADRRRSPVELARSLGRDTFATLLAVRRLARAGLVEPGKSGGTAAQAVVTPRGRATVVSQLRPATPAGAETADKGGAAADTAGAALDKGGAAGNKAGATGDKGGAAGDKGGAAGDNGGAARDRGSAAGDDADAARDDDAEARDKKEGPWDAGPFSLGPLPHRDAHGSTPLPALAFAEPVPPTFDLSDSVLIRIRDALEAMR